MCRCEIRIQEQCEQVFNSALPQLFHFPLASIFRFLFFFPPHLLLLHFPFLLLTARSVCTFLKPLLILLSHTALSVLSVCGFHFTNQFLDTNKTNKQTNNQQRKTADWCKRGVEIAKTNMSCTRVYAHLNLFVPSLCLIAEGTYTRSNGSYRHARKV